MPNTPIHRYVGRVVHLIRQEKGLKQSELAMLTGLKQPNLSRIENALVEPRQTTLQKIAKALGVELEEFYSDARVQDVERKWAASLGPKHAALMMAGKLIAVPLFDTSAGYPAKAGANGEPQARLELVMQLPPFGAETPGTPHFALRVHGDSMDNGKPGSFCPGEVLVFSTKPEVHVKAGDFAFVICPDGGYFRRVEMPNLDNLLLQPLNPNCPVQTVPRAAVVGMWKLVRHIRVF
ncbi:MAG: XRE family transcriptional regulator [Planctomycetota bacterium]